MKKDKGWDTSMGWVCEQHPDKEFPHDDCLGPGIPDRRNIEEKLYCEHCGGEVSEDGYTIDPDKCCYYCKMD